MGASKRSVSVGPSKGGAVVMIIMGLLFLGFGLVLTNLGMADAADEPGLQLALWMFRLIWIVACLGMAGWGLFSLLRRTPLAMVTLSTDEAGSGDAAPDFDTRLRKLAALRQEGLISEEEHDQKRAQIMGEHW